jgi:hypothetical protein
VGLFAANTTSPGEQQQQAGSVGHAARGSSDPFCVIRLGDREVGRSPCINGTLDPVWNDGPHLIEWAGDGETPLPPLSFNLYDWDPAREAVCPSVLVEGKQRGGRERGAAYLEHEPLGTCVVDPNDLPHDVPQQYGGGQDVVGPTGCFHSGGLRVVHPYQGSLSVRIHRYNMGSAWDEEQARVASHRHNTAQTLRFRAQSARDLRERAWEETEVVAVKRLRSKRRAAQSFTMQSTSPDSPGGGGCDVSLEARSTLLTDAEHCASIRSRNQDDHAKVVQATFRKWMRGEVCKNVSATRLAEAFNFFASSQVPPALAAELVAAGRGITGMSSYSARDSDQAQGPPHPSQQFISETCLRVAMLNAGSKRLSKEEMDQMVMHAKTATKNYSSGAQGTPAPASGKASSFSGATTTADGSAAICYAGFVELLKTAQERSPSPGFGKTLALMPQVSSRILACIPVGPTSSYIVPEGKATIVVEHHNDPSTIYNRYNPAKYREAFDRLHVVIRSQFPDFDVLQNPRPNPDRFVSLQEGRDVATPGAALENSYVDMTTRTRVRVPRPGSFEVSLIHNGYRFIIFSKIIAKTWPRSADILAGLGEALQ